MVPRSASLALTLALVQACSSHTCCGSSAVLHQSHTCAFPRPYAEAEEAGAGQLATMEGGLRGKWFDAGGSPLLASRPLGLLCNLILEKSRAWRGGVLALPLLFKPALHTFNQMDKPYDDPSYDAIQVTWTMRTCGRP